MLHPTIDELTNQDFNRYELALATARCARLITDEYVQQKEAAERAMGTSKDADRSVINKLNKEYREEKALKNALTMIKAGDYKLVKNASELNNAQDEAEVVEAEEEAAPQE
jgi:DNA-directed RNA polymerase omega subunit